jgi:hypothetical protein
LFGRLVDSAESILSSFALVGLLAQAIGLPFSVRDVSKAVSQVGDFAKPLHPPGLLQPVVRVAFDFQEAGNLAQRHPEHGAANAGRFMLAGRSVWSVAPPQRDLSETEVVPELLPFDVGRFAVFFAGPLVPALVDELAVVADHLFGIDRDIPLGGIQVEVAEELRGDVDGQAASRRDTRTGVLRSGGIADSSACRTVRR